MLIPFQTLKEKYNAHPKSVLHIGASHGEERDAYQNNGVEAVLWVEAIPNIFEKLKENLGVDDGQRYLGHTAVNACIHETSGLELDFNISSNEGQSSSIFELGTHAEVHPDVVYTHKIKVKTKRADEILPYAPDMVNLDIQGAELLALKSMSWIDKVKYVYTEVNSKELYVGCALIGDIDEYLAQFGFERVETVWAGETFWGDAFYINKRLLNNEISEVDYEETNVANPVAKLEEYFKETPHDKVLEEWEASKELDNVGPTLDEFTKASGITIEPIKNQQLSPKEDLDLLIAEFDKLEPGKLTLAEYAMATGWVNKYLPQRRTPPLQDVMRVVHEWLNSDDTFVTDKDGNKIEGGLIDCKKGSLLERMVDVLIKNKK